MSYSISTGKNDFYRQIFKLAIPIIIQNLLSAAVNSADVIMLNYVGQSSIFCCFAGGDYSSILFMVYYGLGTGASLLCSQYSGKKQICRRSMRQKELRCGFCLDFYTGGADRIYDAAADDAAVYS